MHLYDGSGSPPLVGDGLGFVTAQWRPGDIIIQYHDFDLAEGEFLETGLYDYTTGERLPFLLGGASEPAIRIYP
jgi:hypothetical protein